MVIFYDCIVLCRYIFIFWLKNPAAFKDDFWSAFLNLWVVLVSVLYNLAWALLPGNQPLPYYFCTGIDPSEGSHLAKKSSGHIEVISALLLLFAQVRIYLFKKQAVQGTPMTELRSAFIRFNFIFDLENHSLSSCLMNTACMFAIGVEITLAVLSSKLSYADLIIFPNTLLIYYWFIIAPAFTGVSVSMAYLAFHQDLRKTLIREVKNAL